MIVVHVLQNGLAICLFSDDIPVNWPAGHGWINPHDVEKMGIESITCPECRRLVERLLEGKWKIRVETI